MRICVIDATQALDHVWALGGNIESGFLKSSEKIKRVF